MKKIRILDIFPDIYTDGVEMEVKDRRQIKEQLLEDTGGMIELDYACVEKGSDSIECFYDAAMVVPYIAQMAKKAQDDGYDAAILDCFMDPGLAECREYLTMPIFGVCQSAASLATRMGGEFSIIGILDDMDRCIKENLRTYGYIDMLRSIPTINTTVLELHNDPNVVNTVIEAGKKAVTEDKAKSIIFACTGMSPFVDEVKESLMKQGIDVPVIEPFRAALYDAIGCAMMGIAHSKTAYAPVRDKQRILDWE